MNLGWNKHSEIALSKAPASTTEISLIIVSPQDRQWERKAVWTSGPHCNLRDKWNPRGQTGNHFSLFLQLTLMIGKICRKIWYPFPQSRRATQAKRVGCSWMFERARSMNANENQHPWLWLPRPLLYQFKKLVNSLLSLCALFHKSFRSSELFKWLLFLFRGRFIILAISFLAGLKVTLLADITIFIPP